MAKKLSRSAQRVQDFLSKQGDEFDVKELDSSTRTAADAAGSIGCAVGQIAKSLVFRDGNTDEPVLVVASGANRVDAAKVRLAASLDLRRADGDFVKDRTGFAIGGIPPVAHVTPLRTVLDQDLKQFAEIWAAAGTPHAVFRLTPDRLGALTGGQWIDLREEK
ncbi:Cys-tRNA(Pro)/Cys-tRNA(Cys) deacylase YbaK [Pseudodesulfovibrio hydrargyri]|uniref:Cys-tRNA(Pro)/Cys-tRNA(Cys) deacylase YbaK n=1 Tax=Pseudodesulfovibrio hydrargyri TaxID=2125990 RepID=A0A1J5NIF6_9BACT|nr:YbaK/EbsC family protein [Pseudodesulfovibrio hydrargyri]OIQ51457.1 Cys-tRNA(Pro)/Cys-tRNA(Cys) deacylase YbaK [Pseudodesulfovibrio hydrargyri]